jgi:TetR/AcrR family transcriptional regulator, mexCD-oprJ operon repressor
VPVPAHTPRHDRTAAAILDAAAHVLASEGAGASMTEVASAAGVGRATLYRYYPTREALLDALSAAALRDAGARLADAGLDSVPVEVAVERMVRSLVSVGERYAVLAQERVAPDEMEVDRLLRRPISAVFERGRREGTIRDDLPHEILMELFGGVLQATVQLVITGRLGVEDAAATATAVFLHGAAT